MERVDAALAQGAQAEFQPGQGRKAPAMVTLKRPDGVIADQWTVQGNDRHAMRFVTAYNARLRELRAAAPPQPPPGWPPQGPPPQYPPTTGMTTQHPQWPRLQA